MRVHSVFNDQRLVFNGIHGRTGEYLLPPMTVAEIAQAARGQTFSSNELDDFAARRSQERVNHRGPVEGINPDDLSQTGWAVIFPYAEPGSEPAKRQAQVRDALAPLLDLRRSQATQRSEAHYREIIGMNDAYRPGETKQQFLTRLGVGPGPADPRYMPYYLLLVGSPEEIPYSVQYQLDVQYAVGRIHFDRIEEYACYARSVVEAETQGAVRPQRAAFFGAENPNDLATALSRRYLVEPLARHVADRYPGWQVRTVLGEHATKDRLGALLGDDVPALLFTASHGIGFSSEDSRQRDHQGALVCQDWQGPGASAGPGVYFAGDDILQGADLRGLIAFHFACFSAGTPRQDDFGRWRGEPSRHQAPGSFVARLPQRMLGRPGGGALAVVGHVERAWGSSFLQPHPTDDNAHHPCLTAFESALTSLITGRRLGHAMEYFGARYAEMAATLAEHLHAVETYGQRPDEWALADQWIAATDARNYAVVGDPAVRLATTAEIPGPRVPRPPEVHPAATPQGEPRAIAAPFAQPASVDALAQDLTVHLLQVLRQSTGIEISTHLGPESDAPVARTRFTIEGNTEAHLPVRDGQLDERLWTIHMELLHEAHASRRELWRLLRALLASRQS
ncbi:MAG TPA: hypothetical protein VNM90_11565 [Haliangium sp.]|nr:hypothetical protein [Haliangium sp.]